MASAPPEDSLANLVDRCWQALKNSKMATKLFMRQAPRHPNVEKRDKDRLPRSFNTACKVAIVDLNTALAICNSQVVVFDEIAKQHAARMILTKELCYLAGFNGRDGIELRQKDYHCMKTAEAAYEKFLKENPTARTHADDDPDWRSGAKPASMSTVPWTPPIHVFKFTQAKQVPKSRADDDPDWRRTTP